MKFLRIILFLLFTVSCEKQFDSKLTGIWWKENSRFGNSGTGVYIDKNKKFYSLTCKDRKINVNETKKYYGTIDSSEDSFIVNFDKIDENFYQRMYYKQEDNTLELSYYETNIDTGEDPEEEDFFESIRTMKGIYKKSKSGADCGRDFPENDLFEPDDNFSSAKNIAQGETQDRVMSEDGIDIIQFSTSEKNQHAGFLFSFDEELCLEFFGLIQNNSNNYFWPEEQDDLISCANNYVEMEFESIGTYYLEIEIFPVKRKILNYYSKNIGNYTVSRLY